MLTRKDFLHKLAALPLIALAAPALTGSQQGGVTAVAQNFGSATLTELSPAVPSLSEWQQAVVTNPSLEPTIGTFAPDEAGDWVALIEAEDRSWITFIDKFGRASAWARDEAGQLHILAPTVGYPGGAR